MNKTKKVTAQVARKNIAFPAVKNEGKPAHKVSLTVKPLFYRAKHLAAALGVSKTTLWRLWKRGILPPPTKLGRGIAGWPASEIEALIASRAADDE